VQTVVVAAVAGIGIIMTIVDHMAEMAVVTATTVSNRIIIHGILSIYLIKMNSTNVIDNEIVIFIRIMSGGGPTDDRRGGWGGRDNRDRNGGRDGPQQFNSRWQEPDREGGK